MSNWDVSDVVQLLKTYGASRDTQIFVFRHNIDGATMDESVELLVKDFDLDDLDLESQIISRWKEISSKGLSPKDVLDRDASGKVIQSPSKPVGATAVAALKTSHFPTTSPPKAEPMKPTLAVVASKPEEKPAEDSEPPSRAQFTHRKSAKWSRSGKFSPRALQIEEEPSNTEENATSQPEEAKQETATMKAVSPFHRPPMAWSPSFKRSVKVFRFDDDTVIEIPAEGDDVAPSTPAPVPAAVASPEVAAPILPEPAPEPVEVKEVEPIKPVHQEELKELKIQVEKQPQSAQVKVLVNN